MAKEEQNAQDWTNELWECGTHEISLDDIVDGSRTHSQVVTVRPAGEFPHGRWIADCGNTCCGDKGMAHARRMVACHNACLAVGIKKEPEKTLLALAALAEKCRRFAMASQEENEENLRTMFMELYIDSKRALGMCEEGPLSEQQVRVLLGCETPEAVDCIANGITRFLRRHEKAGKNG